MTNELNNLNLRKARLQLWKESENLCEKFQRPSDAVKPLSAITLKSSNKYGTRKIITTILEKNCLRSKKKTSLISKILKSLEDTPCSTRTNGRHLNNEKIKHKKRIYCPRLTMKHKEKQLKYACQYQTMNARECRKVVFFDKKKFNLDGWDSFQKYWHTKNFPEENYSTRHSGRGSPIIWVGSFLSSGKLQFVCDPQKAADYVKMLNDLSLSQEGCYLHRGKWIFLQDKAAIHNASNKRSTCLNKK